MLTSQLRRVEKLEVDRNIAAFLLTMMGDGDETQWMWKKREIYQAGGAMAFSGFVGLCRERLADHWRIDNVYVIAKELYTLDIPQVAMDAFGYTITSTEDGGFWLKQYGNQVKYYRRKGMARRRALKDIQKEIEGSRYG